MKLWHILVLAALIRAALYIGLNVFFFGGDIEHPDSQVYHEGALLVQSLWDQGHLEVIRYPEYSNLVAVLYNFFGVNRYGPEILNMVMSLLNVALGYKIIENYRGSKKLVAILLAVDPYMAYLSTQFLRDTLILSGTLTLMYGVSRKDLMLPFIGIMITGLLRFRFAFALAIPLFAYSIITKRFGTALWILIGATLLWLMYNPLNEPTAQEFGALAAVTSIEINNSSAYAHREFFTSGYNPEADRFSLVDLAIQPHFWTANNPTEYMFSIYMIYYIIALVTFTIGGFTLSRNRYEFATFIFIVAVLGYFLAVGTVSLNPLIRWRVPLFLFILLGIGLVTDWKHFFDISIGLLLVILLALPSLVIAVALMSSKQDIIFSQRRVGYKRKEFTLYKFTSMIPESDYRMGRKNLRVTKIGKIIRPFALDEIPQLWNLLKGDLSLVGPRPLALWDQRSELDNWSRRYDTKPGFIGPAQLRSRKDDIETKLQMDIEYVESEPSLWQDLKLIFIGISRALLRSW